MTLDPPARDVRERGAATVTQPGGNRPSLTVRQRALAVLCVAFALLGVSVALAGDSPLFALYNRALAERFFGAASLPAAMRALKAFIYGPIGGTIAGKWTAVAAIVVFGFRRRERWALRAAVASLLLWCAVDSTVSAWQRAWFNIYLINLVPLVSVGPLLALERSAFAPAQPAPPRPTLGSFWHKWLEGACITFTLVGVVAAFAYDSPLFAFYRGQLATTFFGTAGVPTDAAELLRFAFGPLGGTIAGQFVALLYLARYPIRRGERWAIDASIASLFAWFIVDSSVSSLHRAWFNLALVNVPTLVVMLPPLIALRRSSRRG